MIAAPDAPWRPVNFAERRGRSDAVDSLVVRHLYLVKRIAYRMLRRMPRSIEADDLIQTGTVGLLEAARRYEARIGSSFATYAGRRIRGAILDSSRRADWCSRSLRRRMRTIEGAKLGIEHRTRSAASPRAVAGEAGISLDAYFRTLRDVNYVLQLSLDDPAPAGDARVQGEPVDEAPGPLEDLQRGELQLAINAAIDALPTAERVIFLLYYEEKLLMREIGIRLSLSESRVCQIHKLSLQKLRAACGNPN